MSIYRNCVTVPDKVSHPPVLDISNPYCPRPLEILQRRMIQKGNKAVVQWLIQWDQVPEENATWVDVNAVRARFTDFS